MNNEESIEGLKATIKKLNISIYKLKEENLKLRTIIGEMQNEKAFN